MYVHIYVHIYVVVIHGGWSSWTCGSCSKTCGGTMSCTRTCDNPVPSCGGNGCSGSSVDERSCNINSPGMTIIITVSMYIRMVHYRPVKLKVVYQLVLLY